MMKNVFYKKSGCLKYRGKKGFTLVEVIITVSLFVLMAGMGVGAYFQYYLLSLMNADINNTVTLMRETRFKALKNPSSDDYGIHIDPSTKTITGFQNVYNPANTGNTDLKLGQLDVLDLNLSPDIGETNEILFETQTGKTENYGDFTIGEENFSYTITINREGVIE
jgi:prepilin-type N-terminal cleavage/methylation domain-containing protein